LMPSTLNVTLEKQSRSCLLRYCFT